MSPHTPGPWKVRDDRSFTPGGSLTIEYVEDQEPLRALIIAEIWTADDQWPGSRVKEPVSLANARLIAAAPEMVELLSRATRAPANWEQWMQDARALLAWIQGA